MNYSFYDQDVVKNNEEEAQKTAQIVYEQTSNAQDNIYCIVGMRSRDYNRRDDDMMDTDDNNGKMTRIRRNDYKILEPLSNTNSYVIDGLQDNNILIKGKINHLVIRDCVNSKIYLGQGVISGIDILYCQGLEIQMKNAVYNYLSIEHSNSVSIFGPVNNESLILIIRSLVVNIGLNETFSNYFDDMMLQDGKWKVYNNKFKSPYLSTYNM
ncbi:Protein with CAP domain, possible adenyl cyclase-associated protein [Orpheovirus IHUMI-LCC2]|uniref:Protein with CAP domain, possible adenyl cyclase-associated protein n=1 Tax=Orpheovirus IHUMI-LCC2 TaxID=2023057 RepID=A0A2I2L591_9VIRU|nr:Protein with CAP domain, possible adenyl cyclase-associated protein [Orpheovirus IHUMI-LCC2]SNW62686.1 Protein with CAP domain, possible adenyl cyclase-associated protein [Orpheovirus IHUMI-LCC2]